MIRSFFFPLLFLYVHLVLVNCAGFDSIQDVQASSVDASGVSSGELQPWDTPSWVGAGWGFM